MKNGFYQMNQLGIGLSYEKMCGNWSKQDYRALFSEIYMKISLFSKLEHNYTSAPIAQLEAHLTFFI